MKNVQINLLGKYACNGRKTNWLLEKVFKTQREALAWIDENFRLVKNDPKGFGGVNFFAYEIIDKES